MSEDWMKPLASGAASALDSAALSYEAGHEKTAADLPQDEQAARQLRTRLQANYVQAQTALLERLALAGITEREQLILAHLMQQNHDRVAFLLESPIESLMLPWLVTMPDRRLRQHVMSTAIPTEDDRRRDRDIRIVPQLVIGRYRLDFAIVVQLQNRTFIMALECDGREFHRVPEDAVRDRYLAAFGVYTLRATGSEINANPQYVAMRVADVIERWIDGDAMVGGP